MSISSGEFSFTDDGQLQCDSAGSFTLRNAHEFDGDEYIKLTINDTVYAGTGTITQGTTTASIEQGSTLITVDMVAGDTIDSIDIQFREPVE
jgi:myosin-crossreactive antigen